MYKRMQHGAIVKKYQLKYRTSIDRNQRQSLVSQQKSFVRQFPHTTTPPACRSTTRTPRPLGQIQSLMWIKPQMTMNTTSSMTKIPMINAATLEFGLFGSRKL